jgi:hypothetical protein
LAKSELELSCCVAIENAVFAGTNDARMLRVESGDGTPHLLTAFDAVEGRDKWYAGAAIVDGKLMGPPLGIRSITATCDGVLLVNVHVGGIPRSTDAGRTWRPTIDIDPDVHQVCAHPTRPDIVIAAAAAGLCISHDAGATWSIEQRGLHALHCSAVAFGANDMFVSASTDPFSAQGAVYRRAIDGNGTLQPIGGGFPQWTEGIVDTGCIASRDSTIALIDQSGSLYVSENHGVSWSRSAVRVPNPSGVFLA